MIDLSGEDKRIADIEEIGELKLPIFLWGTGETAQIIIRQLFKAEGISLRKYGLSPENVHYIVDDEYYEGQDKAVALSDFLGKYADSSVVIFGFYNYRSILEHKKQYEHIIPHLFDFHYTHVGKHILEWKEEAIRKRLREYQNTWQLFSDEYSRITMERYLNAAVYGQFDILYKTCMGGAAYFNDLTSSFTSEIYVDCGAYDGDSIIDFVKEHPDYKKIYAFEPDPDNIKALQIRIGKEALRDVDIVPKGVYQKSTTLHFQSGAQSGSYLAESGDIAVPVVALDELLIDHNETIIIKMDIEGSELDALKGAEQTIRLKHPCLCICVYHKEEDLIEIPHYINSLVKAGTYDYYLRFHGLDLSELVFYAIPRK